MKSTSIEYAFIIVLCIAVIAIIFSIFLFSKLIFIHRRLRDISLVLDDISEGNINRKILANPKDITSVICYKINDMGYSFEKQLIGFKKASQTNKQLMTSLSHDVRTPLTTLIGYLDAVKKGIVNGEEREEYIETARLKAYAMKDYLDTLFEWFKLNSDEEVFAIQSVEICELTRNILKDWIPIFEDKTIDFEIDIPEQYIPIEIDKNAYTRIVSNLIQNILLHSGADSISVSISQLDSSVKIRVSDNGKGIAKEDLLHIFERTYKCNNTNYGKGSGLGLAIVKQLVSKMNGTIAAESELGKGTTFTIQFKFTRFIQG